MHRLVALVEPGPEHGWFVHVPELDAAGIVDEFALIVDTVAAYVHANYQAPDGFEVVVVLLDEWITPHA